MCVNNIKVTVNTYTCTNMFTIIITKDQSGGINDNVVIAQLARDLCLSVNTPRPQASVSKFVIKGLVVPLIFF